ncbi:hypothetical protein [Conexibacter sp. SYSU D00693]|uniref:hypothetical protein n=1 Tax=Conexibacter sp. SYSU D00693 TaxID=2812560 RepID=UPI00196AD255|nr:hypothetical protein [Conexibacter sp. SYSU D00693]
MLIACLAALAVTAAPAEAQRLPTYRSPGFKGSTRTPTTTPAQPPQPVVLAPDGLHPDVVVDEAGTAHMVWSIGRGDEADAAVYCRLKRGATQCDASTQLVPPRTYPENDGPQFDIDNGGPEIIRVGDQLAILTYRYPTVVDKPGGASSGGTFMWTSDDGGTTWTGGVLAAPNDINGNTVAYGPPDSPRIAAIAHTGPCGACVQEIRGGRYNADNAKVGDEGPDRAYGANLAVDGGAPVAAFYDLQNTSYVRRWSGADPITSSATWTPAAPVPGVEPVIAGGAAGLWFMNRPSFGAPFSIRQVTGSAFSAPTQITPANHDAQFATLAQDPSGRLLAAWENRRAEPNGDPAGVFLRTAVGGTGFGTRKLLLAGDAAGQLELAAAQDGGGFLIGNRTGGVTSPGEIVAVGFGNRAPTGAPGLAGLPGGGDPNITQTCQQTNFGAVKVTTNGPCFLRGTGQFAGVRVSEEELDLNGLKIVPDAGVKVVVDPKKRQIYTTGTAKVMLVGGSVSITLWHGKVELAIPEPNVGKPLASFDTEKFPTNLLGFGLRGKIDVILTQTGVRVPISIGLPKYLGDVRGSAELIASTNRGLELKSLAIHVGNVPLGPLVIEKIDITYDGEADRWTGAARLSVPAGGALDGTVEFQGGEFRKGSLALEPPPPGIAIGPAVWITRIGGTFALEPTTIGAEATIAAGAAVKGVSPVSVVGRVDAVFPRTGPFTVTATGNLKVLVLALADARFRFVSDGYADFAANLGLDLPAISLKGGVNGFVDGSNGTFGANASVDVCVDLSFGPISFPCIGGDLALSRVGLAACASADLPEPVGRVSAGLELPWDDVSGAELANPAFAVATVASHLRTPCNTGPYVAPGRPGLKARAAQAPGTATATLRAGLPTATIALTGDGGAPDVDVSGPNGAPLPQGSYVARSGPVNTTYVVLQRPGAGAWTFTPKAGTPAITKLEQSEGYTQAQVRATIRKEGSKRAIAYRVTNGGSGQTVTFAEQGAFGTHVIAQARGANGTTRFTPTEGKGGTRTVYALIGRDGLVTRRIALGRFVQPAPRAPGRPSRVRIKRGASSVTISWRGARGATRHQVTVKGSHGLRRQYVTRARSIRITRLAPGDRITATVRGVSRIGRRGTAVKARSR